MFGYVVNGTIVPQISPSHNTPFPDITAYYSDGSEKSNAALRKIKVRYKKRNKSDVMEIVPPRYQITMTNDPESTPKYFWDIHELSCHLAEKIYSTMDIYLASSKTEDSPKVALKGRELATYFVLMEIVFGLIHALEEKTNVPVPILERFLRYTVYLNAEESEWDELALLAGFDRLVYEKEYDVLQIHLNGSVYPIKRPILKQFASDVVPHLTKLMYRSTRIWVGDNEVSLCQLYYIKKQLDSMVNVTYFRKEYRPTEEQLRHIHRVCGDKLLLAHAKPLIAGA